MSRARPTVVLFDIDGTLIRTGAAGSRALRRTFETLYGAPDAPSRVDVRGNTDRRILRQALAHAGEATDEATLDRTLSHYLGVLADEVERSEGYQVLAGARELVVAATGAGFAVGLGTGNVERGAAIKLGRSGLHPYFAFGGFGSDSEVRSELVGHGARRGAERLGRSLDTCRVVVVGDTPHDVAAARAIGAEVLAVATGGHPVDDLGDADVVVDSLAEVAALAFLLGGADDPPRR
ncbi:MAG: HAD family hydrolase [Polyangiales bacterium]